MAVLRGKVNRKIRCTHLPPKCQLAIWKIESVEDGSREPRIRFTMVPNQPCDRKGTGRRPKAVIQASLKAPVILSRQAPQSRQPLGDSSILRN
jgi:hypothetical protein